MVEAAVEGGRRVGGGVHLDVVDRMMWMVVLLAVGEVVGVGRWKAFRRSSPLDDAWRWTWCWRLKSRFGPHLWNPKLALA